MNSVLVAVGDKIIQNNCSLFFESSGLYCTFAHSKHSILSNVEKHRPAAMLIECELLKSSGIEIVSQCRRHVPNMKIVVVVDSGKLSKRIGLFQMGVDDILVKPFSYYELLVRVTRHAELFFSLKEVASEILCWQNMLCLANSQLYEKSRPHFRLMLTKQQEAVMSQLMSNRLLPSDALMLKADISNTNALAVIVYRLNQLIKQLCSSVVIRSSYGRGYMLTRTHQATFAGETPKRLSPQEESLSQAEEKPPRS